MLPNAFLTDAPQLQNSILPLGARNYSMVATSRLGSVDNLNLNPWWVTGFSDGEGCFHLYMRKEKNSKLGWYVGLHFQITLHQRDKALLEGIKNSLGVGQIYKDGPQSLKFRVQSLKEIKVIIEHFAKYSLITKKRADCELWMQVYEKIERREHLTLSGLHQIVGIKASMNLSLSNVLKKAFPDVVRVERPLVELPHTIDPQWLAGFTSGEGCFHIQIQKSITHSLGQKVILIFQITQHIKDKQLLLKLIELLDCGKIYKRGEAIDLKVTKFSDIVEKIIPFFKKHCIYGVKEQDFRDFCRAADLMEDKKHLTQEGLEQISKIKAGMNRGRKLD